MSNGLKEVEDEKEKHFKIQTETKDTLKGFERK